MMDQYEKIFGTKPKEYTFPLEKSDHNFPQERTSTTRRTDLNYQYTKLRGSYVRNHHGGRRFS
jgi:hypothetical protein